jgi:LysR family hydrogen peroxide-inducible transcriptional activator
MNLRDLRYIVAVADLGHFGKAAEACHVSQPTLSGQILKLEEELGVTLFERAGKSFTLTVPGGRILDHARRAVAAADDILACARASRDPMQGPLRLGVIPTLGPYLMPFVLPPAREKLPATPLHIVEDLTARLVDWVLSGQLDTAIIASNPEAGPLDEIFLFEEPFFLVLPLDHPLAAENIVNAGMIDPQSLLLLADGHCLRDQALELCHHSDSGDHAMADMRATSLQTLLHMTAAGYGLTLVPALALAGDHAVPGNLCTRPLKGAQAARSVRLISRPTNPRKPAIEALAKLIKAELPEDLGRGPV